VDRADDDGFDDGAAAEPGTAFGAAPGSAFERRKRQIGLVLGPVLAVVLGFAADGGPAPKLVGLWVLCITWWLTEALPMAMVALVAAVGAVLLDLAPPRAAFGAFGEPILFLFVGSFFVAEAMRLHGLGARLAVAMTAGAHGRLSLLMRIGMTAFCMSMFMSNAAATAILLPIALSAIPRGDAVGDRRFGGAMVLAVAWGASVGGLGTPVGTPPNLYGLRELDARGVHLDFFEWMQIGVPMGVVMMAGLFVVLAWAFGVRRGQPLPPRTTAAHRPWSRGELAVVIAFSTAVIGWLSPTVVALIAPGSTADAWLAAHLKEEVVALIAGCMLFVLPGHAPGRPYRPALTWPEATRIEWGVILLFGGGILLGDLANKTGLAAEWGRALVDLTGASSTWGVCALATAAAIALSEATSNTATATLMAPLAGGIAHAAGAAEIPAILGATMGASFGFMMPISTAPNALAYATGKVTVPQMVRAGILFDVLGFLLILGTLRLLAPVFGWV
jgi:solute carrier family 13 (sodium-dependent dicarboxylate transporter), member 2/3/5